MDKKNISIFSRINNKLSKASLVTKLRFSFVAILTPTFFVCIICMLRIWDSTVRYDQVVQNASVASGFSNDFKSDFDHKIYLIIRGSQSFASPSPYEDIRNAREILSELMNTSDYESSREKIEEIEKYLVSLERFVNQIEKYKSEGGHYDDSINIWENDIQRVTSLIQDSILEYTYYSTSELKGVSVNLRNMAVQTFQWTALLMLIIIIIAFFLSIFIPESISRPIREIANVTNQVAQGDLSVRVKGENGMEARMLSGSINIMIEKLSGLLETVKIEQENLRKAEFELLQAQINPHFLYNTLDTIVWLAESGDQREVVNMVESLSDFFRTSLSQGKKCITLEEERCHVESYLKIQQIRYRDIMEYEIDIPEKFYNYYIPKITLQPLVENALYHGVKNKRGKGKITIKAYEEGENLILEVADNGQGIRNERLEEIEKGLEKNTPYEKEGFFGIRNVNERIRLLYGENSGITIKSQYKKGSNVYILLPINENNMDNFLKSKENQLFK